MIPLEEALSLRHWEEHITGGARAAAAPVGEGGRGEEGPTSGACPPPVGVPGSCPWGRCWTGGPGSHFSKCVPGSSRGPDQQRVEPAEHNADPAVGRPGACPGPSRPRGCWGRMRPGTLRASLALCLQDPGGRESDRCPALGHSAEKPEGHAVPAHGSGASSRRRSRSTWPVLGRPRDGRGAVAGRGCGPQPEVAHPRPLALCGRQLLDGRRASCVCAAFTS